MKGNLHREGKASKSGRPDNCSNEDPQKMLAIGEKKGEGVTTKSSLARSGTHKKTQLHSSKVTPHAEPAAEDH